MSRSTATKTVALGALFGAITTIAPVAYGSEVWGVGWDVLPFCDVCSSAHDVVETNAVDPTALPEGSIPPPFSDADIKDLPQGKSQGPVKRGAKRLARGAMPEQIEGLELHGKKAEIDRYLRHASDDPIAVTLKLLASADFALFSPNGSVWSPQVGRGELSFECGRSLGPQPLRRERFSWDPDGKGGTVEIDDGWFDRDACSSHLERATRVHAAVVVRHADKPALAGLRDGESVVLIPVPGVVSSPLVFSDAGGRPESDGLIRLPMGGGRASSALFDVVPVALAAKARPQVVLSAENVQNVAAIAVPAAAVEDVHAIVVQVSQSVSESSATMLVQLASDAIRPLRRRRFTKMMRALD